MKILEFALNDIACSGCLGKIKREIKKYPGVEMAKILTGSGKILISFQEDILQQEEISSTLRKITLRTFD